MARQTPGPYEVLRVKDGEEWPDYARIVATILTPDEQAMLIVTVATEDPGLVLRTQAYANAALFAAADDLYEALKSLLKTTGSASDRLDRRDRARVALAKAVSE